MANVEPLEDNDRGFEQRARLGATPLLSEKTTEIAARQRDIGVHVAQYIHAHLQRAR